MKAESQCYREDDIANTIVNGTNPGFHNGVVVEDDKCLNGWDVQSKHIQPEEGKAETLYSGECRYGGGESYVMQKEPIAFEPGSSSRVGGHVYEDGKTGTIRANAGDNQQSVAYVQVETEVQVRKYPVDVPKLIECLQSHRAMKVGDIAERLNKPKTLVEHWFRKDKYFAIPDADIWFELKELLGIDTNEFDKSITTFETQPGKYDMNNRIHLGDVAPTQTANGENTMYCVPVENHPNDSRCKISEDGIVQTLSGRMGTGGNNTPMVLEDQCWDGTQISPTLTANNADGSQRMPDKENFNAVISTYGLDRASFNQGQNAQFDFSVEEELAPTIVSRGAGAVMSKKED